MLVAVVILLSVPARRLGARFAAVAHRAEWYCLAESLNSDDDPS